MACVFACEVIMCFVCVLVAMLILAVCNVDECFFCSECQGWAVQLCEMKSEASSASILPDMLHAELRTTLTLISKSWSTSNMPFDTFSHGSLPWVGGCPALTGWTDVDNTIAWTNCGEHFSQDCLPHLHVWQISKAHAQVVQMFLLTQRLFCNSRNTKLHCSCPVCRFICYIKSLLNL